MPYLMLLFAMLASAAVTALAVSLGMRASLYRTVPNYAGRPVAIAGLGLAAGLLAGLGVAAGAGERVPVAGIVVVAGFALFGAIDDRYGDRSASGFRGHLRAALHGRLTTGFLKVLGGGATALAAALLLPDRGPAWEIILRAAVVALGANALNLLDTRPARVAAVSVVLFGVTFACGGPASLALPGVAGALAFFPWDRGRRAMLGDAGSNALGALWALSAVAVAPWPVSLALLLVLMAVHAWTEGHSLNAALAGHPTLARLDRWITG